MDPTCWQKLFNTGWSKDQKPSPEDIKGWLWEPGTLAYEGDSNVALTNPSMVHPDCFNIGMPGDIPETVVAQFPELEKRHEITPVKKVCVQVGGNNWTWKYLNPIDLNLKDYVKYMTEVARLYKSILPGADIVLASLPFVDPSLKLKDMNGIKIYPKNIQKKYANITLNNIFRIASHELQNVCEKEGVVFLDIFTPLQFMWKRRGRDAWYDQVHYAKDCQSFVGSLIRHAWGIR